MPPRQEMLRRAMIAVPVLLAIGLLSWLSISTRDRTRTDLAPNDSRDKIIVVFPFENLGPAEDAYFAEGISDDIVSRLTSVAGIGVISRTTAIRYDRTDKSLDQIAEDLGVDFVLDGTIRWDRRTTGPSRVRVTPHLVRVEDGTSVWSTIMDRDLEDVFGLQSEISRQVVTNIDISLLPAKGHPIELGRPRSPAAYDLYLRAKKYSRWGMGPTEEQLLAAADLLERAVALDPDFARAHAALSRVYSAMHFRNFEATPERLSQAELAADRALELEPQLAEAHLAKGLYHYRSDRDYSSALAEMQTARTLAPGNGEIASWIGTIRKRQGRFREATEILHEARRLDPGNPTISGELSIVYRALGDYESAIAFYDQVRILDPDAVDPLFRTSLLLNWRGEIDPLRNLLEEIDPDRRLGLDWARLLILERQFDEALAILDSSSQDSTLNDSVRAEVSLQRARVLAWLNEPKLSAQAAANAAALFEPLVAQSKYDEGPLGVAYALQGRRADALRCAERALESNPVSKDVLQAANQFEVAAEIHVHVDDLPRALALLDRCLGLDGTTSTHNIELEPVWDPLRTLPEYAELIRRHDRSR